MTPVSAPAITVDQRFQKLPLYSSLAIGGVLALQVSGLAWSVVHKPGDAASPLAARPWQRQTPLNIGEIVGAHLFGQTAADPTQVTPTELPLQLVGTWADADPESGMAVVRESDGAPQRLVPVGGELPGGATLREVYARRIVFERDGKYEELAFPENPLQEADPPSLHAVESLQVEGEEGTAAAQDEPTAAEPTAAEPTAAEPESTAAASEGSDGEH